MLNKKENHFKIISAFVDVRL